MSSLSVELFTKLLSEHGLTARQIDFKVDHGRICLVAKHIAHWKILAKYLGLTKSEISAITEVEKGKNMLEEWIKKNDATYLHVVQVCLKADEIEVATQICQTLHQLQGITSCACMYSSKIT